MNLEEKDNKDRNKALIITASAHVLLLLLFIFFGLSYQEPRPQNGYVINFGNSEVGFGNQQDGAQSSQKVTPQTPVKQEKVETDQNADQSVNTQNVTDAPAINNQSSKQVESNNTEKTTEAEKPQPSDNLSKLLQNVKNSKPGGEGEKKGPGDQGESNGDVNSQNRDGGGGGSLGTGNYRLGNRKALEKLKPTYEPCKDQGKVVVKIYVDRNGKVSRAVPGEKIPNGPASTTTSRCLYAKAKSAALKTTWQADGDAPDLQVGYIIYNFFKS